MDVFDLVAKLTLDTSDYEQSIKDAAEKANGLGNKLFTAGKAMNTVGGLMSKSVTIPAINAGKAIFGFAQEAASASDNIDKMSQRLGMSREAYQEWDYVLSQAGVDIDSMKTGFKTLTNTIGKVTEAGDTAGTAFEALGIGMEDIAGKSQEDIFALTVSRLQGLEDQTIKATLSQELFGRSGQEMIPLLNESAESTQALVEKAHELGMVLDDEAIDAGVNFTDTLDTMKRAFTAAGNELGSKLAPYIIQLADFITTKGVPAVTEIVDKVSSAVDWFNNLNPSIQKTIGIVTAAVVAAGPVMAVIGNVVSFGGMIISGVSKVTSLASGLIGAIGALNPVTIAIVAGITAVIAVGVALYKNWDKIKAAAESLKEKVSTVVENIKTKFGEIVTKVTEVATGIIDKFKNLPSQMLSIGGNLITGLWNGISGKAAWLFEKVGGFASDVIEKVKGVFGVHSPSRVFDWIGQMLPEGLERGWDKKIGSVQRNIADSLTFGSSIAPTASAAGGMANTTLNNNITITLEGDAARLFTVMRQQNDVFKKSTGQNAFA